MNAENERESNFTSRLCVIFGKQITVKNADQRNSENIPRIFEARGGGEGGVSRERETIKSDFF